MLKSDVIAITAILISIIGTILSGYLSYHFAIKGEKRKEFNAVADKLTLSLMQQRETALSGSYPAKVLSASDVNALLIVCQNKQQKNPIHFAYMRYYCSLTDCGGWVSGNYDFHSPEILIKAIDDLLKCCARK